MDALVHLSLREGLPRALPQALAAAKPVVAYDCDGASEVCLDGQTGFLVQPGDLTGLKNRLLQLAGDAGLREKLGQCGQQLCPRKFRRRKNGGRHLQSLFETGRRTRPALVSFPFNYFLAAFAGAFLTTLLALPLWRKWCLRVNLVDDPGRRKIHDAPIPLAGGFAVLTGILLPLVVGALFCLDPASKIPACSPPIAYGLNRRALELAAIAFGAIAITLLGWLDDKHELKPLPKFAGQLLIAMVVAMACKRITLFVHSEVFSYAITILWLLTVINAFNFMDNMNGLCAGLGAIGALLFAIIAAANGEYLVALTGFLMCGALLGFSAVEFPERPRVSRRRRQPSRRLSARGHGHPAALLHETKSASARRALAAAGAGRSAGRPRASRHFADTSTANRSGSATPTIFRTGSCAQGLSRTRAVLVLWLMAVMIGIFAVL